MISTPLIAGSRCHFTFSASPPSSFCFSTPKPANPLGLNLKASVIYVRNGLCQSHFRYLACFQQFSLENRPIFSKRVHEHSAIRCFSCNRYSVSCPPLPHVVVGQRAESKNIPTMQAGMWLEISSLPGKSRIGSVAKLIGYRTSGCRLSVRGFRLMPVACPVPSRVHVNAPSSMPTFRHRRRARSRRDLRECIRLRLLHDDLQRNAGGSIGTRTYHDVERARLDHLVHVAIQHLQLAGRQLEFERPRLARFQTQRARIRATASPDAFTDATRW